MTTPADLVDVVPERIPEEIAVIERILWNERLNIWKRRVQVGDAIFVRVRSSGAFLEGVVQELDFKTCLVGVQTPSGVEVVGLTDVSFVQLLCPTRKTPRPTAAEAQPPKLKPGQDACANKSLLWTKFQVGDKVRVQIANDTTSFEAVVAEINWKYGFVGLSTPSGVTYVPIDSFTAVEKLCAKTAEAGEIIVVERRVMVASW